MKILKILFANMPLVLLLMAIYALSCAVATFIESSHSSAAARASVYGTWWFELVHIWLLLSLIGCFVVSKAWERKKYASLLLHFSFIVIILGAGITRYFGFEGLMPIKEDTSSNMMFSSEPYVIVQGFDKSTKEIIGVEIQHNSTRFAQYNLSFFGQDVVATLENIGTHTNEFGMSYQALDVQLKILNNEDTQKAIQSDTAHIIQSQVGDMPDYTRIDMGEYIFFVGWGSKVYTLPFSIYLEKFVLDRYPGSNAPSSYASFVQVQDSLNDAQQDAVIFMNNVLDYGGYRFFQSSYFPDESGTILSVNNDPGKIPTYIGYALLIIGCIWLLFDKNGRFMYLAHFVRSKSIAGVLGLGLCCLLPQQIKANDIESIPTTQEVAQFIENLKANSKDFSKDFSKVLLQDFGGRIKPVDSIASDYIHKITGKDGFLGLNNTQIFLGIAIYPEYFRHIKMIRTKSPKLREILGNDPKRKYIAAIDAYASDGTYLLKNYVEQANQKPLKDQDTFDKDVIALNEKLYLFGLIYSGKILRVLPDTDSQNSTWYDFEDAMFKAQMQQDEQGYQELYHIIASLSQGFSQGVEKNEWGLALKGLQMLNTYQEQHGSSLIISPTKVQAEVLLNQLRIFDTLTYPYIILGVVLFLIVLGHIIAAKTPNPNVHRAFWIFIALLLVVHTFGLGLRWYVSGHAPWSNAYESMLYIAWAGALAGVVCFRKSSLALCAASFLAGITLFVAHLGDMDPQIGNLVPVLKSYWLNIHVSVITASYGFLGLCFVLGCISLLLFLLRSSKRAHIDDSILSLVAINEMSMILGLFLLTIGNFLGAIWANESWGRYWGWDPKETWALISIGVYAIILHLRLLRFNNMPFIFSVASVFGFFSILMTYFGVNYFLTGMHSYAGGDAAKVPTFIYVLVVCLVALTIAASFKKTLSMPK